MESNKTTPEPNKTSTSQTTGTPAGNKPTSTTGQTGQTGQSGQTGQTNYSTGASPQRARETGPDVNRTGGEGSGRSSQVYDQTRQVVSNAYDKTSETLTQTYDQAMSYGRENPGTLTLIAFGAGIGIGLLLASGFSGGRSRTSRIAEPVVNALSQIAMEVFR